MQRTYYIFNPGRMSRCDNTLRFTAYDKDGKESKPKYIPIEGVENLYIFGSLDANSGLYNFLAKHKVAVHFFDYYEHYTGSFMPKEYLLAGKVQIAQTKHHLKTVKRLPIARCFIDAAAHNILKNLRYYHNRGNAKLGEAINAIEVYAAAISDAENTAQLMGIEGNIRKAYYKAFNHIINDFNIKKRTRQPPTDPINVLISFGNMMCYAACLDAIYHTQLNPTISFLHEPGFRRYSLALDIAEIFKPILVDRVIFKVMNKKMVRPNDFDQKLNYCLLKDGGKKRFIQAYEDRLKETIRHRGLGKQVSYKRLIRLECYKLVKHMLEMETYKPLKMWW